MLELSLVAVPGTLSGSLIEEGQLGFKLTFRNGVLLSQVVV